MSNATGADTSTTSTDLDACVSGVPWCEGTCLDDLRGLAEGESPESLYHAAPPVDVRVRAHMAGPRMFNVTLFRSDVEGQPGPSRISILTGDDDFSVSVKNARKFAAALLNRSDIADPPPVGEAIIPAGEVRVGDEFLTVDGWQHVTGLMDFANQSYVQLFTPQAADGWEIDRFEPVRVHRFSRPQDAPRRSRRVLVEVAR